MLFGDVANKIASFDLSLLAVTFEEVDLTCALGTQNVQTNAQRFRLSISAHDFCGA